MGGDTCRTPPIPRSALEKDPRPRPLFEGNPVDKGIQIQLDSMIEGRVRPKYLPGDYEYNPETFSLLSLSGKEDYYIGDRLSVTLRSSDPESKHIDFSINSKVEENKLVGVASKNKELKIKAKNKRACSK